MFSMEQIQMERPMFYKHKRLSFQHQSSTNFGKIVNSDVSLRCMYRSGRLVKCVHVKCQVEAYKYHVDKHHSGFLVPLND
jgi:hypothetical protein